MKKSISKLLYLSTSKIPSTTANSIHVFKMAQAFSHLVSEVKLIGIGSWKLKQRSSVDLEKHYGVKKRFKLTTLKMVKGLRGYDYRKRVMAIAEKEKPDIIYTRSAIIALKSIGVDYDVVYECHSLVSCERPVIAKLILSPHLKAVVVISEALRQIMIKEFGQSIDNLIIVAHDGVDLERFASVAQKSPDQFRSQLGLPNRPTVCYSGHLYKGRGIEFTLELAGLLPDINFLFVGGLAHDVERCRELSKSFGLTNTTFTGFVPNRDLPNYLRASDILIMPYLNKVTVHNNSSLDTGGWMSPMKMFEYMASLRPIITTDLPVLREVLNEQQSIMIEAGNHQMWRESIKKLISDKSLAQNLARTAYVNVQDYDWSIRAKRILSKISLC